MLVNPHVILWIAGLLFGLGSGLMLGRTFQPASVSKPLEQTTENIAPFAPRGLENVLFDPVPATAPAYLSRSAISRYQTQSPFPSEKAPLEPNPFPAGEAAPVQPQEPLLNSGKQTAKKQPGSMPVSGFRQQLESMAPELNEESLDELERIREVIEAPVDPSANLKTMLSDSPETASTPETTAKSEPKTATPAEDTGD